MLDKANELTINYKKNKSHDNYQTKNTQISV